MGFENWAPIFGEWDLTHDTARYVHGSPASGLVLSPHSFTDGSVSVKCQRDAEAGESAPETDLLPGARIIFGYDIRNMFAFSGGYGHVGGQYLFERLVPGEGGWTPVSMSGSPGELPAGRARKLEIRLLGQRALLLIDEVPVLDTQMTGTSTGSQLGLMAWGQYPVTFEDFEIHTSQPRLFVVMQFGHPFDDLYHDVIQPVGSGAGFQTIRADDMPGPGVILADIMREIRESSAVVAEISARNPNVFYEVGYAHAVGTPTVLLVRRDEPLPFDVSGFRCIVYDDTIGGKQHVETELRRHLDAISAGRTLSASTS